MERGELLGDGHVETPPSAGRVKVRHVLAHVRVLGRGGVHETADLRRIFAGMRREFAEMGIGWVVGAGRRGS